MGPIPGPMGPPMGEQTFICYRASLRKLRTIHILGFRGRGGGFRGRGRGRGRNRFFRGARQGNRSDSAGEVSFHSRSKSHHKIPITIE